MKRQPTEWEKIFANDATNKGLICKIYKQVTQLNNTKQNKTKTQTTQSKNGQLYIYIYPHISSLLRLPPTLPIPPRQVVTKHQADLPVLCGCFPLAIYFTFVSVYMSMPLSHFIPAYPSPSLCPQVHSLRLRLYSCPAPRFFRTIIFVGGKIWGYMYMYS